MLLSVQLLAERASLSSKHFNELSERIKASEKRLSEIAELRKHIINYSKTRDVYVAYRKAGYSKKFYEAHREELTIHQAAKEAFSAFPQGKIPKVKELNEEYAVVLEEKRKAYQEYRQAKKNMQDYLIAKKNIDIIFDSMKIDEGGQYFETLKWLAYKKWEDRENSSPSFECPCCGKKVESGFPYDKDSWKCPECGGDIFLTDMLGFHLDMNEDNAADTVASTYMLIMEMLMLFTVIRLQWKNKDQNVWWLKGFVTHELNIMWAFVLHYVKITAFFTQPTTCFFSTQTFQIAVVVVDTVMTSCRARRFFISFIMKLYLFSDSSRIFSQSSSDILKGGSSD